MLKKKYDICGVNVTLRCSALLPKLYRAEYNRDLLKDFQMLTTKLNEGVDGETSDVISEILYMMASHAGYEGTEEDFLMQFDNPAFAYVAAPSLFDIWNAGMTTTSAPAKKKGAPRGKTTAQPSP